MNTKILVILAMGTVMFTASITPVYALSWQQNYNHCISDLISVKGDHINEGDMKYCQNEADISQKPKQSLSDWQSNYHHCMSELLKSKWGVNNNDVQNCKNAADQGLSGF